jgi:DNA-damage-inducible protein J
VSKSAYIRVRIEPELKIQVGAIFNELGVTEAQIITMLYKQMVRNHEIPQEIARAIEEARKE